MTISISNNAKAFISNAISSSDTQIIIPLGSYEPFLKNGGDYMYAILVNADSDKEIVKIDIAASRPHSVISDGVETTYVGGLVVERGQGVASARAWIEGSLVYNEITETILNIIKQKGNYRSITYNPNGVLSPEYDNERVYQSDDKAWWQAVGGTTVWGKIAGS